jgi:hypothetical protein
MNGSQEQVDRLRLRLHIIMNKVDELERRSGCGGWFAETIQETCDAIARDFGFRPYRDGFAAPPAPAAIDEQEALRDSIGQAIADKLVEWSENNSVTLDPFDSRNIDEIADAVVAALAARAPQAAPAGVVRVKRGGGAKFGLATVVVEWLPGAEQLANGVHTLYAGAPQAEPVQGACDRPPSGWLCSRQKSHEGPCAARPEVAQPEGRGIELAAQWVQQRLDDFVREHGLTDPDTGAVEFGHGQRAQAQEEYVDELMTIIDGLRALAAHTEPAPQPTAQPEQAQGGGKW